MVVCRTHAAAAGSSSSIAAPPQLPEPPGAAHSGGSRHRAVLDLELDLHEHEVAASKPADGHRNADGRYSRWEAPRQWQRVGTQPRKLLEVLLPCAPHPHSPPHSAPALPAWRRQQLH
jgi:hypothetical protein